MVVEEYRRQCVKRVQTQIHALLSDACSELPLPWAQSITIQTSRPTTKPPRFVGCAWNISGAPPSYLSGALVRVWVVVKGRKTWSEAPGGAWCRCIWRRVIKRPSSRFLEGYSQAKAAWILIRQGAMRHDCQGPAPSPRAAAAEYRCVCTYMVSKQMMDAVRLSSMNGLPVWAQPEIAARPALWTMQ
jgi:hypothetical protein